MIIQFHSTSANVAFVIIIRPITPLCNPTPWCLSVISVTDANVSYAFMIKNLSLVMILAVYSTLSKLERTFLRWTFKSCWRIRCTWNRDQIEGTGLAPDIQCPVPITKPIIATTVINAFDDPCLNKDRLKLCEFERQAWNKKSELGTYQASSVQLSSPNADRYDDHHAHSTKGKDSRSKEVSLCLINSISTNLEKKMIHLGC